MDEDFDDLLTNEHQLDDNDIYEQLQYYSASSAEPFAMQFASSSSIYSMHDDVQYNHPLINVLRINNDIQMEIRKLLEIVDAMLREDRQVSFSLPIQSSSTSFQADRRFWINLEQPCRNVCMKRVKRFVDLFQELRSAETFPMKTRVLEYFNITRSRPIWAQREEILLASSIRQQNERNMLRSLVEQRKSSGASDASLREQFYEIRNMSAAMLEEPLEGIDWNRIAESIRIGGIDRSAVECKAHWTVLLHPSVARSSQDWTKDEADRLNQLVEQFGAKGRWVEIAAALGTYRSAWSCLKQYQRSGPSLFATGRWSKEDDAELLSAVHQVGLNWSEVVDLISTDRSSQQCMHRYTKAINPTKVRGRWTAYEDACLKAAVKLHGSKDWWLLEHYVPRRTDMQCRERWLNVLSPDVDWAEFTPEEDRALLSAVRRHGQGHWSLIARTYLPRRTDNQCWRRWKKLQSANPNVSRKSRRRLASVPSPSPSETPTAPRRRRKS